MGFPKVLEYAHLLVKERIHEGDIVIDATCGNGNDTAFLANLIGDTGKVIGFDIQEQAIINTKNKLKESQLEHRVECIKDSHENITLYVNQPLKAAMFNLGYLPGSDKKVTTMSDSTLKAIDSILKNLLVGGIITIILYLVHDEALEAKKVESYLAHLNQKEYSIIKYRFLNQVHLPPYLIAIEKVK